VRAIIFRAILPTSADLEDSMMPLKVSRSSLLGLFDLVSKCGEDLQPLLSLNQKSIGIHGSASMPVTQLFNTKRWSTRS
jgi:hypothetical protein